MRQIIMIQVLFIAFVIQHNFINAEPLNNKTTVQNTITDQTEVKDNTNIKHTDNILSAHVNEEPSPPTPSSLCEKRDKPYFLPHKYEISKFYVCVKGQLFLLNCPSGYRFNKEADQCLRKTAEDEIEETLKTPVLIPHEKNCGWYYVVRAGPNGDRVLNSCPMPQLFDMATLECKNYTEVDCKNRFEPKDACDYQIRTSAHAYPCSYLPSCKNRSDGLYPDRLRDCRMYFRCTSERSSESFSCSQTALPFGERFSLKEQRCLPAQYVECNNDENKPL